jgi:hypothetical protein
VIEYMMWPPDIDKLSPEEDYSFYFEVFGEVSPRIASEYTQVPLPEEDAGLKQCINFAPLYEYYWSLGFVDLDGKCGPDTWGGELAETAAEVYLYFPTTGGWRVEEMLATIKYLCPSREHLSHLKDAAEMFSAAKPIVEDASKLASVGSMLPGVGPIAASSAVLLNTIARLKITSVAPTNDYVWSVQKVATVQKDGLLQGVKWTISKNLFVELGSRLTGSIAVNIIPSRLQSSSERSGNETGDIRLKPLPVRAAAVMHLHPQRFGKDERVPLPSEEFLELEIKPRALGVRPDRDSSTGPTA